MRTNNVKGVYYIGSLAMTLKCIKGSFSRKGLLFFAKTTFFWLKLFFGTRDLFNISYSRELYLVSKFLHFEEIVRVIMAVCFEMIVSETYTTVQLFINMSFVADFHSKVELLLS